MVKHAVTDGRLTQIFKKSLLCLLNGVTSFQVNYTETIGIAMLML